MHDMRMHPNYDAPRPNSRLDIVRYEEEDIPTRIVQAKTME